MMAAIRKVGKAIRNSLYSLKTERGKSGFHVARRLSQLTGPWNNTSNNNNRNTWDYCRHLLPEYVCTYLPFSSFNHPFEMRRTHLKRRALSQLRTTVSLAKLCQVGSGLSGEICVSASPPQASHHFPSWAHAS